MNRVLQGLLFAGLALATSWAWSQTSFQACGDPFTNGVGPHDYRKKGENVKERKVIEGAHFPPHVELLIRGSTSVYIGGDIEYTLRAIPNHHRALVSMVNLSAREKSPKPRGAQYTIHCYFDRAVRYTPDDIVVRLLFAQYLGKQAQQNEALAQVEAARNLAGDSAWSQYNIGLVLAEMKQYDQALIQAHKAMAMGYTRTELKDQLVAAGKWVAPAAPAASAASAVPPASAAKAQSD